MEELERRLATLEREVSIICDWKEAVAPMLHKLADDQAYRARWAEERGKRWADVDGGFLDCMPIRFSPMSTGFRGE